MSGGHLEARRGRGAAALVAVVCALFACSNDPYPPSDEDALVYYSSFSDPPRTLDPATAYSARAHTITGAVYDTLLEYHYLKRPLELIPGLAASLPEVVDLGEGRSLYRFRLREDLLFHDDPCFELGGQGRRTREIESADIAYQIARLADPDVGSPVIEPFSNVRGFMDFAKALAERREEDPAFAALRAHEQYAAIGGIAGVRTPDRYALEVELARPYPQIVYWFAMEFTTPVPWEAIEYYDGDEGRPRFADHPVGSGPFQLAVYDKQARWVLEKSENWYGVRHPEWRAPAAVYPSEGTEEQRELGLLDRAGEPLPLIDRVEVRREKESIPRFTKFLQGYYDGSGIAKESFDQVIQDGALSPEMIDKGVWLARTIEPVVFYLGFNMDDAIVGNADGEKSRKLRQAMSLVIDGEEFLRIFTNGRGMAAQSALPPGIYGYDPDYQNPYRQVDVERAKRLMVEAGYPGGVDPATGEALRLVFSSYNTSTAGLLQYQWYTQAWRQLGIDVDIEATNYNQFQEKVRRGALQVFEFGWGADYPDPENFLFLFWSEMSRVRNGGPNETNFSNAEFDRLFVSMKTRPNGPERLAEIRRLIGIVEEEAVWIPIFHRETYALYHGWIGRSIDYGISIPTYQFRGVDPALRAEKRVDWNVPVTWPAWLLLIAFVVVVAPGVATYWKERQ